MSTLLYLTDDDLYSRHVVTAAHCVATLAVETIGVAIGYTDLSARPGQELPYTA